MGSYLDARHNRGLWKLRFDDIDEIRTVPGAENYILSQLTQLGFQWDDDILYQSLQKSTYLAALKQLQRMHLVYPCSCTRAEIAAHGMNGIEGSIYPGTCRNGLTAGAAERSLRIVTDAIPVKFTDRISGYFAQNIGQAIGDFIIRRVDGFYAYQLAVVVDDQLQGVTHVVRGADLLASTPRQIYLHRLLGINTPVYAHLPLVLDATGRKLSKSDADNPIRLETPIATLQQAWNFLVPDIQALDVASTTAFWHWAISTWRIRDVRRCNKSQPQEATDTRD